MTTLNLTTRLVTVPRHRDSLTHAIEKSGLDHGVVTSYNSMGRWSDNYEITGLPRADDDVTRLTITLTADELNAVQVALGRAGFGMSYWHGTDSDADKLELLHLRTLLAEAAAPPATRPICPVHHRTDCG